MKAHFEMMAAYNAWANRRLYAAVATVPEAEYRADLGVFFKSIEGTLNHLMIGDLLWLARLREQPQPRFELDQMLHDDLVDLTAAREALDQDIIRFVDEMPEDVLAEEFSFRALTLPGEQRERFDRALTHVFNHQTHHRGQVHALLTRMTGTAPALDLLYYLRDGEN